MLSFALACLLCQSLLLLPAQDPTTVAPRAYRRSFENERVRVTRVHYEPRERVPAHDHPDNATVYVYLRDSGPVRFVHTGEEAFTLVRPAVRAGGFRLSRGSKETHSVESLTDRPTDFLRIELKGLDAAERRPFYGRFPPEPRAARRSRQRLRYENARVRIFSLSCAARGACDNLVSSDTASLLVALSPARPRPSGGGSELLLALGDTRWAEPGAPSAFVNAGDTPAEFLRIDLK